MWIVVRDWDGDDTTVNEFNEKEEAKNYFESLKDETSAKMYLAKVEEVFNQ